MYKESKVKMLFVNTNKKDTAIVGLLKQLNQYDLSDNSGVLIKALECAWLAGHMEGYRQAIENKIDLP